ncbi:hypothetical protein [Streptacidiphilus fuscans]|uniref:Secreted protein n=1 Tax=Streptacidiphilus fuscans TaxID=2789292 RepID=A0A931B2I3_9ACTN|nr:hypothetical protein [Streptacidiphilus fuscans]MBF9069071.1 hypothetical protein [Streptacidiphilus fuscans]
MRNLAKAALVATLALGAVAGVSTDALADTTNQGTGWANVDQPTAAGDGFAAVYWTTSTKTAPASAFAVIDNAHSGYNLNGWLERSTDGGRTWYTVSGVDSVNYPNADVTIQTYNYYDGPGYLARACFQFTSWSGAAVHCTAAI